MRISDTIWILGFQKDSNGNRVPGATVMKQYDLAAMGLAWDTNIDTNPLFLQTLREIRELFNAI
jgi:hypothetical protein